MLLKTMVILDKILIGLGGAVVTGMFGLIAKYAILNPADEALGACMDRLKELEKEEAMKSPRQ